MLVGTVAGLGAIDGDIWAMLVRQSALGVMSAAITLPVAWAATLSRSVLGGVSVAIGLVVVAQVSVLAGLGGWMPLAASGAVGGLARRRCHSDPTGDGDPIRCGLCPPDRAVLASDATGQVVR